MVTRAVVSGGGRGQGGTCPPGPVEPDKLSLWIEDFHYSKDLFSLHSVVFIVVTCSCLPFSWRGNRLVPMCANGKQYEAKPPIEIDVYHLHDSL